MPGLRSQPHPRFQRRASESGRLARRLNQLEGDMKQPQPPSNAAQLTTVVTKHYTDKGFVVVGT